MSRKKHKTYPTNQQQSGSNAKNQRTQGQGAQSQGSGSETNGENLVAPFVVPLPFFEP